MKTKYLFYCLIVLLGIGTTRVNAQAVNINDSLALVDLYNATNGPNWYNHTNWLAGPVSTWVHVQVDGDRVTSLFLDNNNLTGELTPSIGNLEKLQELYLSYNNLKGPLPAELGNLHGLFDFIAHNNRFRGHIPGSFGGLASLYSLDLSHNQLTGPIPVSFYKIPVQTLFLSYNHLKESRNIPYKGQAYKFTATVDLHHNDFNFNGLEFVAQVFNPYSKLYCIPQALLALHRQNNALSVDAGGTLSNNTYKWFKVGEAGSITITGDSIYMPATSGRYYAQVTNAVVKRLTLYTDTIDYTAPLAAGSLSVYPNPAKNTTYIAGLNAKSTGTITVTDYAGNSWLSAIVQQQSTAKFNVSELKPGNYVIKVKEGSTTRTAKFVKE